ncbi:unnamed protein product [Lymnaea stagnalis]|uniref:Uncharacterized protein n=1 Tax=Lymnaea stagnalis TaxID=6523 RepID=A0AAV2IKI5_LYMST
MTTRTNSSDTFLSIENKSSLINMEGEHLYRQRFQNMKLVLKELQEQLAIYKNRCAGVDTVALMLKESKLEVVKLTRQCKAFETAVANLQNRLSTNGLSSSVNIEETEVYVPGASKQTLDNLARENARLRSQLKNNEGQNGKRSLEDHYLSKDVLENFEAENKQLKEQLQESENLRLGLANQYKANIEKLKAEYELQLQTLEQALKEQLQKKRSYSKDEDERKEIGCQTAEEPPSKIEELRESLKHLSRQCLDLGNDLENIYLVENYHTKENSQVKEKMSGVSEEVYADLERRLNQVVMMNQRWQAHNDSQEQQVHLLGARIAELEDINQDMENLRAETEILRLENQRLKYDVENLTRESKQRRPQPEMDHGLVEILKQQIQVCTEDFNTERKDREQAVNRAKALQDEVNRLKNERDLLKQEVEMFKANKSPPETPVDRRIPGYQPIANLNRYKMRGVDYNMQRVPPHLSPAPYWSSGPSPSSSISPVTSPVPMSFSSNSMAGDRSSSYAPSSQDSAVGLSTRGGAQRPPAGHTDTNFHSMPRAMRSSTPDNSQISGISQQHDSGNVSMPAVSRKTSSTSSSGKTKGDYLTCPKCNQEFSEKQEQDLLAHIEQCKD